MLRFLTGFGIGAGLAVGVVLTQLPERPLFVDGAKAQLLARADGEEVCIPSSALRAAGAGVTITEERVALQFVPLKGMEEQPYVEGIIGEYVSNERLRFGSAPAGFGEPTKLIIQFRDSGGRKALKPVRINLKPEGIGHGGFTRGSA